MHIVDWTTMTAAAAGQLGTMVALVALFLEVRRWREAAQSDAEVTRQREMAEFFAAAQRAIYLAHALKPLSKPRFWQDGHRAEFLTQLMLEHLPPVGDAVAKLVRPRHSSQVCEAAAELADAVAALVENSHSAASKKAGQDATGHLASALEAWGQAWATARGVSELVWPPPSDSGGITDPDFDTTPPGPCELMAFGAAALVRTLWLFVRHQNRMRVGLAPFGVAIVFAGFRDGLLAAAGVAAVLGALLYAAIVLPLFLARAGARGRILLYARTPVGRAVAIVMPQRRRRGTRKFSTPESYEAIGLMSVPTPEAARLSRSDRPAARLLRAAIAVARAEGIEVHFRAGNRQLAEKLYVPAGFGYLTPGEAHRRRPRMTTRRQRRRTSSSRSTPVSPGWETPGWAL